MELQEKELEEIRIGKLIIKEPKDVCRFTI